jgi:dynein heavy chain
MQRAIKKKGKNMILEIGGDPIDYDPRFKLFIITKLFNPHFLPEVAACATLINFIVTEGGLEDQLLAMVVRTEKAELEQEKDDLVKQQNMF